MGANNQEGTDYLSKIKKQNKLLLIILILLIVVYIGVVVKYGDIKVI